MVLPPAEDGTEGADPAGPDAHGRISGGAAQRAAHRRRGHQGDRRPGCWQGCRGFAVPGNFPGK